MGKHSARDGATVHPLVADALERRQLGTAHVVEAGTALQSADVGWPGDSGRGEGLGWPGDGPVEQISRDPEDDGSVLAVLDEAAAHEAAAVTAEPTSVGEQPARRHGWRRFFGGSGRSTSAA